MQSLSNQPTWLDTLVVPLPLEEFREQFLGSTGSLCGTLPMFSSPQVEHKHPIEHQDVGKRIPQRLHEMVQTSCAPSGVLQHGPHPANLQENHLFGYIIL